MALEIERKFLLSSEDWRGTADGGTRMIQGYFATGYEGPTVRVRIAGECGFLTIKGRMNGISRSEFEYEIPREDAESMLREFCASRLVEKVRFLVEYEGFTWEIDEYSGRNAGLFTAEIELPASSTPFARPPWLGQEVSLDRRYSNGSLSVIPYSEW